MGPSERGWLLAYVGVLVALVQGGGVGMLAKRFDERKLAGGALLAWAGPRSPGLVASALAGMTPYYAWKRLVREDCLAADAAAGSCEGIS